MLAPEVTPLVPAEQVARYEPLCRWVSRHYFAPGLDRDDLMQEARIGVLKAIRDFNGERGNLDAFVRLAVERQVITAVKAATRQKHGPLNQAVTMVRDDDGEWADVLDLIPAAGTDPLEPLQRRERMREVATMLRERLSDLECACLIGVLNGESYERIGAREGMDVKGVDRAVTRARWKLNGEGPPSCRDRYADARRRGAHGYRCPTCGGATVKKPGRGRPPRCVVCRVKEARAA